MTGIILLDKPQGFTSFDAVAKVRRICGEKKCGHSGTLDPMATGVMTILLGGATRFCELLPSHDKAYIAKLRLGTITDTLDITGKILEEREVNSSSDDFRNAAEGFKGEITQVPPMYSAVSVNGRRLYDLARQGIEVERPERQVTIHKLDILNEDEKSGEYEIYVECSSGTYIRTLIADIGEKLGCGAVLTELRRVKANGFTIAETVTLEELIKAGEEGRINDLLISVENAYKSYNSLVVTEAQAKRFSNGGDLLVERLKDCKGNGLYKIYNPDKKFLGIGEIDGGDSLKVRRIYQER